MQILKSNILIQSCTWDFEKDGGAVGLQQTKIVIPAGAIIVLVLIRVIENVNSLSTQINIQDSTGFGLSSVPVFPAAVITPADSTTSTTQTISNGLPLVMEIFLNPVTSGKVAFDVVYVLGAAN